MEYKEENKQEEQIAKLHDEVQEKLDSIKKREQTVSKLIVEGSTVTPQMVEWHRVWKRAGRISWDGRSQLSEYFQQLTGSPIRDINCDGCIRDAWDKLEEAVIKYNSKPL